MGAGFRLVTNPLDRPPELLAEMYRLRWIIEMLFRTFKQLLGCKMVWYDLIGTRGWGSPKRPRFDGSPKRKPG